MKKILLLILASIFMLTPALASNIEILPTMQTKSKVEDRVWVGTFQIVWNDFMDKIAHTEIKFPGGTPVIVNELNKQTFTIEDLSEKCYYRYVNRVKKNTKKVITKAIKKQFNETSDILDQLDLTPDKNKFLVYAMLKKDFKFISAFDKLGKSQFRDSEAEYFGINQNSEKELCNNVEVLFYNNPSDYAVVLKTVDKDIVYLYKTSNNKAFNYIYSDMLKKEEQFEGNKKFTDNDLLKVPNLKFFEEKSFEEVCGSRIKGTNLMIDQALETIKFNMDNTGVELKSEAAIIAKMTAIKPSETRNFAFDDTFVVFLQEKDKSQPYFALRVHDISKFQ